MIKYYKKTDGNLADSDEPELIVSSFSFANKYEDKYCMIPGAWLTYENYQNGKAFTGSVLTDEVFESNFITL